MIRAFHAFSRMLLGFCLVSGLTSVVLRAQLDPRLQPANSTDFLDLYQQSTSTRVKPEIATVFDFSGSMAALMFHPLFSNTDILDNNASNNMTFNLVTPATSYAITATAAGHTSATETITFNVATGTAATTGSSTHKSYTVGPITMSPSTASAGQTVTFSCSFTVPSGGNATLNWTTSGGSPASGTSTGTIGSTTTCTFSWVVPGAASAAVATVIGDSGTGGVGTLNSIALIKPDGTAVAATDADAAKTSTSGLYGLSSGKNDIRNWVRAASHARFQYSDSGVIRTVDIPIPWKSLGTGCSGNPLSSETVLDQVTVTNPDNTTTTYGSGLQMDLDLNWTLDSGSDVLSGGSGEETSCTLSTTLYKQYYIDWLFLGKYANGSYSGKYIVYDAVGTSSASYAGGQTNAAWGAGFGTFGSSDQILVPQYDTLGNYLKEVYQSASSNVIPARARQQAVKEAAIRTWINFQGSVFWAFRFLDVNNEANPTTTNTINNNSKTNLATGNPLTSAMNGGDSGWTLLNNTDGINSTTGNSVTGMKRIAALFANNGTPLTYAVARGLAQFTDPNSVFNAVETGTDAPSQCMNHFLIVFTDGVDNNNTNTSNPNDSSPYLMTAGAGAVTTAGTASIGNANVLANQAYVNRTGKWWNIMSFTGIAAHLADPAQSSSLVAPTYPSSGSPSAYLPYAITGRAGTSFKVNHRISTMTVGVSLGGKFNDVTSPKNHLFAAAAVGDVTSSSWDTNVLQPFALANPSDPTQGRQSGTINFFDATNPTLVSTSLYYAFLEATLESNINATSTPNIPFVGAAFANEVYLGSFTPPATGGPVWSGDLLMFDTKLVSGQTVVLGTDGNPLTAGQVTAAHAQWSAASALTTTNKRWSNRHLYTRVPGSAATPEPGLTAFSDLSPAYATISTNLATDLTTDNAKKAVIQFVMGGDTNGGMDTSTPPRPTTNRASIMGDIIDSTPAAIEYNLGDWTTQIAGNAALSKVTGPNHFRLLLVGTNQGWLHGFGEVTTVTPTKDANNVSQPLVTGQVDELWAFMPTDFLAQLDYITVPNNPHRFMVDGAPTIYFLDLPPSTGGQGNGVVDQSAYYSSSSTGPERTVVIVGLGKGGRSYYALDIHNPFSPTLLWSLVPDEYSDAKTPAKNTWNSATPFKFPASRIATGGPDQDTVTTILANWGYSTCTPSIGRIQFKGVMHDAVFFGGGFSTPQVEAKFAGTPQLGRSILAVDAYSGQVLAAVDLTSTRISATTMGPIASSVVPFEYFLGSGMAQRAYFSDYSGGLWAWGSKQVDTTTGSATLGYRIDSSDLTHWTTDGTASGNPGVRKVYQDSNSRNVYSATPAPFRVGTFPGRPKSSTLASPTAVGIAMVSGNRNNPLDYNYNSSTIPANYRVTVAFDRQDSQNWGLDTNAGPDAGMKDGSAIASLLDVSTFAQSNSSPAPDAVTPGTATYYLAPTTGNPYFGYYVNFPGVTSKGYFPKGITSPTVISGSLFYSYFTPTLADPCTGGSGLTTTSIICDAINPVPTDTRTNYACASGTTFTWNGVASNFVAYGTTGAIQGGVVVPSGSPAGTAGVLQLQTTSGRSQARHPKIRVWRTIQ